MILVFDWCLSIDTAVKVICKSFCAISLLSYFLGLRYLIFHAFSMWHPGGGGGGGGGGGADLA